MRPGEQLPTPEEAVDEGRDPGDFSGPLEWYWHFSQRNDFQVDSEQLKVLEQLERLFQELMKSLSISIRTGRDEVAKSSRPSSQETWFGTRIAPPCSGMFSRP